MNEFGDKLKALRVHRKLEQKELAACLDIKPDIVSKYEVGTLKNPTLSTLKSFANALGVTIDYFASNYSPELFIQRGKQVDTADKIASLPENIRTHYQRLIQFDYDQTILRKANQPIHKRRNSDHQVPEESETEDFENMASNS